ncbi:MAG: copper resistance CopC/CopD family protein, partial [Acidimicrobiia bacterium]
RLGSSPGEVVVQFTEAVTSGSVEVDVTSGAGDVIDIGSPEVESDGRVVRIPLLASVEGVAVVSWHVVSALDGHESAGEFAFAVGETGQLPAATGTDSAGAAETAWRWVFLAGLSVAVGALVAAATGQLDPSRRVFLARLGLIVAALGPAAVYGSAVSQGLSAGTVGMGVAALLLAIASLTAPRQMAASVLTGTAILAWATRSHTATVGGLLGTLADAAHLGGASLWLGTLALLVADLWRARKGGGSMLEPARRYSRWVLRAVIVLAFGGLASTVFVLTTPSDLWTTGYGRILILKVALFAVALMLAAAGRWRALREGRVGLLRRLTTVEVVVVAGIVAASGILAATSPPALAPER